MIRAHLLLTVFALEAGVVGSSELECRRESEPAREVLAVANGIIAADNARELERVMSFYATDAVLMPPNEPAVVGHEAIRPRYEQLFANFLPEIELSVDEVCATDDLAFARGHNSGRLVGRRREEVRDLSDAFLMLLRRGDDRAWRISHLIWHRAPVPSNPPDNQADHN